MPEIPTHKTTMILLAAAVGFFFGSALTGTYFLLRGWRLPGDRDRIEADAYQAGFANGMARSGWTCDDN
jgi:hypothetical protein